MTEPSSGRWVLFVYGTLLAGEAHHEAYLGSATFLSAASTADGFALADLGEHPALVLRPGAGRVVGELYGVDRRTLRAIDGLEDHPATYRRERIPLADGSCAWAYLLDEDHVWGRPVIPSGDWRRR